MNTHMPVARIVLAAFVAILVPRAGALGADIGPAEAASLERAVDSAVGGLVPNVFRDARATYLEGYGVIVTIEVALDVPRNPFSGTRSPEEVRRSTNERVSAIRQAAIDLLAREAAAIDGLAADETATVIVYTVNPNPIDLPDLPGQILVSVGKQDALDLASGALTRAAFTDRVQVRED